MASPEYYPTTFHFMAVFEGLGANPLDVRFQSISGLEVSYETETFKEGGENRFEHVFPARTKYSDLILKRGVVTPKASGITQWCQNAFMNQIVLPINIEIFLLDPRNVALMYWKVIHAWPKSWKLTEFNAETSAILIETLELSYNRFELKEGIGL